MSAVAAFQYRTYAAMRLAAASSETEEEKKEPESRGSGGGGGGDGGDGGDGTPTWTVHRIVGASTGAAPLARKRILLRLPFSPSRIAS